MGFTKENIVDFGGGLKSWADAEGPPLWTPGFLLQCLRTLEGVLWGLGAQCSVFLRSLSFLGKFGPCGFLYPLEFACSPLLLGPRGICTRLKSPPSLWDVGGQRAGSNPLPAPTPALGCGLVGRPVRCVVEPSSPC